MAESKVSSSKTKEKSEIDLECTYTWKKISDIDGITQDEVKQKLFEMPKSRPIVTPINAPDKLFDYYPCQITNISPVKLTTIVGGLMGWQSEFGNKTPTSFSIKC